MRSEQQHIDDFFRNKDEEWAPDSSRLNTHWQQMTTLLTTPAVQPAGKKVRIHSSRRIIKFLGGLAIVTVVTLVTITTTKNKKALPAKSKTPAAAVVTPAKPAAQKTIAATVPPIAVPAAKKAVPVTTKQSPHKTKQSVKTATVVLPVKKKVSRTVADVPVKPAPKKVNAAALINEFYNGFKKGAQEFTIQPDRDNTLTAKEGTRLMIPANTFVNSKGTVKQEIIKIVITEYYSYADIAAAKLSTTSNGEQLVTAGMIHVKAEAGGEPVQIAPGKTININIPAKITDNRMQLFLGTSNTDNLYNYNLKGGDTLSSQTDATSANTAINWIPTGWKNTLFTSDKPRVNALDISVDPHRVTYGKKTTTAKFLVNQSLLMSDEEIKQLLYKRYGTYYDKIKIRRVRSKDDNTRIDTVFGMDLLEASSLKLISRVDSVRAMEKFKKDSTASALRKDKLSGYLFTTNTLGWINCDRFLDYSGPKVNFTFNLGEGVEAGNFVSQLVFTRYRSVMSSTNSGNKILFGKIPENEPVQLISVGVKDGKVVSCIQSFTTSGNVITNLNFEETTPAEFRKKLESVLVTQ